jgi:hypothetical protein
VINPAELMSVELDCNRDVNAPEFIIVGVPKVTAGAGGSAGGEVIKIPLSILIPPSITIAICYPLK